VILLHLFLNVVILLLIEKKRPLRYTSIISEVFDGRVVNSVECLTCHEVCRMSSFVVKERACYTFFIAEHCDRKDSQVEKISSEPNIL